MSRRLNYFLIKIIIINNNPQYFSLFLWAFIPEVLQPTKI